MTAPPILKLSPDCIENTTQWDLSIIQAWMLWPHDEAKRDSAIVSATIEFGRSIEPILSDDVMRGLFLMAVPAQPLVEVQKRTEAPHLNGAIAGKILHRLVRRMLNGETGGSLSKVQNEITASFQASDHKGANTIKTIWGNYRRVSHFWAAYIDRVSTHNDRAFPCSLDRLSAFFGMADSFRVFGEENGPQQHPGRVLFRRDECLRIPEEIDFPRVVLSRQGAK
jgi:hypothetical protein